MSIPVVRESPSPSPSHGPTLYQITPWRTEWGIVAGIAARPADYTLAGAAPVGSAALDWASFRSLHQPGFRAFAAGSQVHGNTVAVHRDLVEGLTLVAATDGHVTSAAGMMLCVTVADCIPVYLASTGGPRAVGILHAGWRGIAGGILERGIEALISVAGCPAADIISHCGIGICDKCYEVGPEVVAQVTGQAVQGPSTLDLRRAARQRLLRAGLRQVTTSPWCSAHDDGRFHSHRGSRGKAGRMVAFIGRPLA